MVSTVGTDVIERIAAQYDFRGEGVVEALTDAGPDVATLLLEAADRIAAFFGTEARLVLEFFIDPNDMDDPGELFALIQTPLELEQARPLIARFRDDWWLLALPRARGLLNIGLEYV